MARVYVRPDLDDIVAHLQGVGAAVHAEGDKIAARAESNLAGHRKTGAAHIEVEHSETDSYVSLVDGTPQNTNALPALAIEYGHKVKTKNGEEWVPGLYIITKAAGFA